MPDTAPLSAERVLYVMAAEAEYGPHLRARITPLITGVGPVEAGVVVGAALARLAAQAQAPRLVVSLGSAGSARLEQGAIYQASSVGYRDMDASPLGFDKGVTPFLDIPPILPLGPFVPSLKRATLSTGANIISGSMYQAIDADMVDMETYAVRRACDLFGLPLVALRGISDGVEELRHIGSWTQYLHLVDEGLAAAVDALEAAIAGDTLEWPEPMGRAQFNV